MLPFNIGYKYKLRHNEEKLINDLPALTCYGMHMEVRREAMHSFQGVFGLFDFSTKAKKAVKFYGAGLPVTYSGQHKGLDFFKGQMG
jgi:hypothetical protein